jgi:hypothetical protein
VATLVHASSISVTVTVRANIVMTLRSVNKDVSSNQRVIEGIYQSTLHDAGEG